MDELMLNWTGLTGVTAGLAAGGLIFLATVVCVLLIQGLVIVGRNIAGPALAGLRSRWAIWRTRRDEAAGARRLNRTLRRAGIAPLSDVTVRTPYLDREAPAPIGALRSVRAGKLGLLVSGGQGNAPVALDPLEQALLRKTSCGWDVAERQNYHVEEPEEAAPVGTWTSANCSVRVAESNKLEGHEPCWCGSGQAFSGCHLLKAAKASAGNTSDLPLEDSRDGLDAGVEARIDDLGDGVRDVAGRVRALERQVKRLGDLVDGDGDGVADSLEARIQAMDREALEECARIWDGISRLSPRVTALEAAAERGGETPTEPEPSSGTQAWVDQIRASLDADNAPLADQRQIWKSSDPKSEDIKPGDLVTWGTKDWDYEVMGVHGGCLDLKHAESGGTANKIVSKVERPRLTHGMWVRSGGGLHGWPDGPMQLEKLTSLGSWHLGGCLLAWTKQLIPVAPPSEANVEGRPS